MKKQFENSKKYEVQFIGEVEERAYLVITRSLSVPAKRVSYGGDTEMYIKTLEEQLDYSHQLLTLYDCIKYNKVVTGEFLNHIAEIMPVVMKWLDAEELEFYN